MAKAKKIKDNNLGEFLAHELDTTIVNSFVASTLPYALRRELEEIQKNSGKVIDYTLPIEELEKICNKANNPPDSWRTRWEE